LISNVLEITMLIWHKFFSVGKNCKRFAIIHIPVQKLKGVYNSKEKLNESTNEKEKKRGTKQ
jgi:hypothetical protein